MENVQKTTTCAHLRNVLLRSKVALRSRNNNDQRSQVAVPSVRLREVSAPTPLRGIRGDDFYTTKTFVFDENHAPSDPGLEEALSCPLLPSPIRHNPTSPSTTCEVQRRGSRCALVSPRGRVLRELWRFAPQKPVQMAKWQGRKPSRRTGYASTLGVLTNRMPKSSPALTA